MLWVKAKSQTLIPMKYNSNKHDKDTIIITSMCTSASIDSKLPMNM